LRRYRSCHGSECEEIRWNNRRKSNLICFFRPGLGSKLAQNLLFSCRIDGFLLFRPGRFSKFAPILNRPGNCRPNGAIPNNNSVTFPAHERHFIDSKFTVISTMYYLSLPNSEKEIRHPFGSIGLEYFRSLVR
jgi:hypothetical protein